ncbi:MULTISPECIES: zf-TFIIB domain-containing protein [unclassified Dinoroseobacter]|uniref:TFIIB-type zinc ribbon-containing protein n=1 Tax=unclassified Dinoroseobacter TaxID=2620028 RepID=UPI003C799AF8
MKCPIDGTELVMTDRSGVEIDYCPSCRGVWLDRGELDKIIERSVPASAPKPTRDFDDDYPGGRAPRRKKKESFLMELFDF